jgi:hypothetical protein
MPLCEHLAMKVDRPTVLCSDIGRDAGVGPCLLWCFGAFVVPFVARHKRNDAICMHPPYCRNVNIGSVGAQTT